MYVELRGLLLSSFYLQISLFHIFYIFFGFFILETQVTYLIFLVPVDSSGFLPGCFYFSSPFPQLYYFPVT